ncbi:sugar phosphate isomerase/epimerase family protein [Agrobacterium tumefaciens]|uniref:Sugar phosphate isomerase/epimerase n=1 Tax=Agrobacterium tumefaciens TaxID=358 RepID=A0A4D7YV58_AGRTU|nr:sugar phosphate isomerase/epimerase [Agrobacterium tumefaciens]QCL97746.1 sugar phosphate isomerase/epimerase [Agrobacterium tumefaciens]
MKRSIATVTMSGTLKEKLNAASSAGFAGIELMESDIAGHKPREIAAMISDFGLEIDVLQPFRNFEGVSSEQHMANLERARRAFDLMAELGTSLMLVCSNTSDVAICDDNLSSDQLAEIADIAADRSLKIGFEALSWGTCISTYDHAYKVVRTANHKGLGIVLDSFHTLALQDPLLDIPSIDPGQLFYVQIADAPMLSLPLIDWSRHHRRLPGNGDMDVGAFLRSVTQTGYNGTISLEIFSDELKGRPALEVAREGMDSLKKLEADISTR